MAFLRNKLAVAIIVLSVTFLILIGYSVKRENRSLVEGGAGVALNSVQSIFYRISDRVSGFVYSIVNISEIKKENEYLRTRNSELEEKALKYEVVASQNERLRGLLDFKDRNSFFQYITCHIIGRTGTGVVDGDGYTIDKGTRDGVTKGMVVVTAEGLVGQVTVTSAYWSTVQTLANENIAVAAAVENTKENNGIVKGYRDFNKRFLAKIYHLPLNSIVKKGDVILTSGEGDLYPKGIRIGQVLEVEEDRGKIMKNAIIQPYVDFNRLEEVLVIVPKDRDNMKYSGEIKQ